MIAVVLVTGVLVGVFSALFGVGGSVLMVPFMTLALGLGQHASEGTALLVVVPTAIAGAFAHSKRGYVDFRAAALLAAGGVTGAYAGARLALAVPGETLKLGFGIFLVVVGARLVVHGTRRGPRDGETERTA
ncbi:MAG TPA: sulfite exporter TauE/SafE family protein [Actinomycetota bacterium]|nr:sulfite exporter TauE/SafE family protein [Actinomycetota bacterium]